MTSRLITPADAVESLRRKVHQKWAEAVCADLGVGDLVTFSVPLRPGVSTGRAVARIGHATWHEWHMRWREFTDRHPAGVVIVRRPVSVQGVTDDYPATLVADLDAAVALATPSTG